MGPQQVALRITVIAAIVTGVLLPSLARGQQASAISGIVRDTSGAVLPGVTVEASSPALIERVRTAVTDGEGRYTIIDLRPGPYAVTFTLSGFNVFRRDGVQLTSGFTATVNAEMQVGAVEETITVTGVAPLVDAQSVHQQTVLQEELLDALPTSTRGVATFATLIPGMAGTTDVGGSAGTYSSNSPRTNTYHGKSGVKLQYDGMRVNNLVGAGDSTGFMINPATAAETVIETGGVSAESPASGVSLNLIPREGSNRFSFDTSVVFTNDTFQSNNLTDELRARGLTSVNQVVNLYDTNSSLGGPLKQDRLWFFTAHRFAGSRTQIAGLYWNETQGTPFYTPDLSRPADPYERLNSHALRLTWQATAAHKVNLFTDVQTNCTCGRTSFIAPEADTQRRFWPQALIQATWSSPVTTRLLLEAGASATISHWPTRPTTSAVTPTDISIVEQSTGLRYNAAASYNDPQDSDRFAQRAAVSYVTGSHAFKAGFQLEQGIRNTGTSTNGDVTYRFLNGVPNQITQLATPYLAKERLKADLGVYVQDRWTFGRATLIGGLRYDYLNAYVPAQEVPAGRFLAARSFAPVKGVPAWHDVNPRFGASYDLLGDGKTAIKASLGRYVGVQGLAIAAANNPITTTVNSVNRTWNDSNRDYVPDCELRNPAANGECGDLSDVNFGQLNITTHYADDAIRGFRARDSFWDASVELQRELTEGISLTAGYYRNWYSNFLVTDNTEVGPSDFDPYCVTAPADPRLPNGGGYDVCGLYDVSPSRFGHVSNVVTQASNYGKQARRSNFFNVSLTTRLASGVRIGGGVDTGQTVTDRCFVVDSPQELLHCRTKTPFASQTQVKIYGSYPLPADVTISATFQNVGGPAIEANYPVPNSQIAASLGRNLGACGARTSCTATAVVPLIAPETQFEERRTQVDLRLTKLLRLGPRLRIEANLDVYNVFNASPILLSNNTYGPQWRRPIANLNTTAVLPARLIELSGQLSF